MSIQEFYSIMIDLWDQLALTKSAELKACGAYIERKEQQRLVHTTRFYSFTYRHNSLV